MKSILDSKTKIKTELDEACDYVISMEEKVYKSKKISLELLKQLKNAETDISSLE